MTDLAIVTENVLVLLQIFNALSDRLVETDPEIERLDCEALVN